ncbi:MAG: phenylalanine--tRNA ligase subunit alpha, partial [Bacteroidia bacterium]|nr:phenylalanine--tRNA ligase subunit alpha [Bacteroidia bacterium]
MLEKIETIKAEVAALEFKNAADVENFRLKYLSKKGLINQLLVDFRELNGEEKKSTGKPLNELKAQLEAMFRDAEAAFVLENTAGEEFDRSLPLAAITPGALHPLTVVKNQLCDIFYSLGFDLSEGPEIEDDWHNFSALNFAEDHPARDMQDTFFTGDYVLRTHTSSVQIREMETAQPPFRLIMPGRVYRNEAVSARSNCFFHQIEGLYVDEGVTFADLKQTLFYFVQQFFGEGTQVRFRASYFPFTEPSAEMDIWAGTDT